MQGEESRRALPQLRRPKGAVVAGGLASGVLGTGLLYTAATGGTLVDLLLGAVLFGTGLWLVGWPFVVATAHLSDSRSRKKTTHD